MRTHLDPRAALALLVALAGCGGGGPDLGSIDDQVIAVGEPFELELVASTSASADELDYTFASNAPGAGDAHLASRPDGTALFTWTPTAADAGAWTFDFVAADPTGRAVESVTIDVRSTIGAASMPVFQRPLGAGVAVTPSTAPGGCILVQLGVTDQDSTEVAFTEQPPLIKGGQLLQQGPFDADWRWCPTDMQRRAQDRYLLTVAADDGVNPKAVKRYQIVLRADKRPECPGDLPVVDHAASDRATIDPIVIEAKVSDDAGLAAAPIVYYTRKPGPDPRTIEGRTPVMMTPIDPGPRPTSWRAELPNPLEAGETEANLYYAIVAEDNDDAAGECDHEVIEPYQLRVRRPSANEGELDTCDVCTADAQCGGPDDDCVLLGTEGASYCFRGCDDASACGEGFVCSPIEVVSVDGRAARQCVPVDERCAAAECADDVLEPNDGIGEARPLELGGTAELRMCPVASTMGSDEDWFAFEVTEESRVSIAIAGAPYPSIDLALIDASGERIGASEDWGSSDDIVRCLTPGTYYARAYSYFAGDNAYALSLTSTPMSCPAPGTCDDDDYEDDDGPGEAREPVFQADDRYGSADNQICRGDDDYYHVVLRAGETVYAALAFERTLWNEDLDLIVYDEDGTLLTPCCDLENGQSSGSGEHLAFTAPAAGGYYVAVHGWNGSENAYDICLALRDGVCD
jgi:hypothetical protein